VTRRPTPLAALSLLTGLVGLAGAARAGDGDALFEDWSERAGLRGVHGSRVSFADVDGDGFPDAVVGCTKVLLNEGGRKLRRSERAAQLETEATRGTAFVQLGDVDGDGDLDLLVGRDLDLLVEDGKLPDDAAALRTELWLGDGRGGFARRERSGLGAALESSKSACFVDFDRDGRLDVFIGNSYVVYGASLEAFPDRLFRGRGDGTFEDVTERSGLLGVAETGRADSRRPTYGVSHTDWNDDGRQDLLVMTYGRQWNRLWRNDGDGRFTDVAPETGFDGDADRSGQYPAGSDRTKEKPFRANGNTFDAAVADFDGDGDMDCFLAEIAHWWAGPSSDRSMLLENLGAPGGFKLRRDPARIPPRPHASERWNEGDLHAGWLDVDNDGFLDLAVASSDYPDEQVLRLYRQRPDGSRAFDDWTDRLGFRWVNASQISLGDFDRDGATDILVGTSHMRLTPEQRAARDLSAGLFRNRAAAAAGNRFLTLRLGGGQAIGARVTLVAGGRRQTREVSGGLGHAGHRDDTDCRFGVGKAAKADRLEVRWPDAAGTVQVFEGVETDRFYRLAKGGKLEAAER